MIYPEGISKNVKTNKETISDSAVIQEALNIQLSSISDRISEIECKLSLAEARLQNINWYYAINKTLNPIFSFRPIDKRKYDLIVEYLNQYGDLKKIVIATNIKKCRVKIIAYGLAFITVKYGNQIAVVDKVNNQLLRFLI